MRLVKLGVASVNTTVGAFRSNVDRALEIAQAMGDDEVTLGAFQEQLVSGYPAEDLVQWQSFVDQQWTELARFADQTAALPTAFVVGVTVAVQGLRYNCAAVVAGGRVLGLVPKEKLPTYSVFYEARTFSRGTRGQVETCHGVPLGDHVFAFDFGCLAVEVCEDIWTSDGPMRGRAYAGAEIVVNISASPFRIGVVETRREMIATRAADHQCTVVYANAVGGNDGLIFDGGGYVNQNGRELLDAPRFRQGFVTVVVDLDRTSRLRAESTTWRSDREAFMRSGDPLPRTIDVEVERWAAGRRALRYPVPAHGSFHLPPDLRRSAGRRSALRGRPRCARSRRRRLLREDRRLSLHRSRAVRRPRLCALAADRASLGGPLGPRPVHAHSDVLHAHTLLFAGDPTGRGDAGPRAGRAVRGGVDRRGLRPRDRRRCRRCSRPANA